MASGNISIKTNTSSWKVRCHWSTTTYASSNKTKISMKYQIYRDIEGTVTNVSTYFGWCGITYGNLTRFDEHQFEERITVEPKTWTTISSWSFTIPHKADGTRTVQVWGAVDSETLTIFPEWEEYPMNEYIKLPTITRGATISTAPNFTDEDNPTITYSNKSGSDTTLIQAAISLDGSKDDIAYRDIPIDGTSYTFELTDAERELLRNATLNGSVSRKVRFYVKSTADGNTYYRYLEKTFTVANCMPEIHATLYDVNEKTVALTQNSDWFVIGASDLQFQVEATPKKGGTITGYNTICGSKNSTLQQDTFFQIEANEIVFTATDNRGQTATYTWPFETINYVRPTCELELGELTIDDAGEATASVPVKISGTFFNSTFGEEGVLNEFIIEFLHTGQDDWVELTDGLVPIVEGENYKLEFTVQGLDYKKQLKFQARFTDKATTVESVERTARLMPIFDWSDEDFNFNVPVSIEGNSLADYVIETGSDSMGSNGTWYWQKWKSGKAECWGYRNYGNMAITTTFGELYVSTDFKQSLPSGLFGEPPYFISIEPMSGGYGTWISKGYQDEATTDETMTFCLVRAKSNTLTQAKIGFHAIGSWLEPLG